MFAAPRDLPALPLLLDDLGHPSADALARHLSTSTRTVYSWKRSGQAPRAAALALYWESRWGRSQADCDAYNTALVHRQHAASLERQNATLRARIARLEAIGVFDSANAPGLLETAASVALHRHLDGSAPLAR